MKQPDDLKHYYPERHPPVPPEARRGQTTPAGPTPETDDRAPRLPHENDESSRSQGSGTPAHEAQGRRAYRDARSAAQDTDRAPVTDALYHRLASRSTPSPRNGAPDGRR